MAANLTELLESAVRDGSELAPWTEANTAALADERTDDLVVEAFGGPCAAELAVGVPLLRFADTSLPALPLIQAVMNPPQHRALVCDRCEKPIPRGGKSHALWIASGVSVVVVHTCGLCRDVLDDVAGASLTWA